MITFFGPDETVFLHSNHFRSCSSNQRCQLRWIYLLTQGCWEAPDTVTRGASFNLAADFGQNQTV